MENWIKDWLLFSRSLNLNDRCPVCVSHGDVNLTDRMLYAGRQWLCVMQSALVVFDDEFLTNANIWTCVHSQGMFLSKEMLLIFRYREILAYMQAVSNMNSSSLSTTQQCFIIGINNVYLIMYQTYHGTSLVTNVTCLYYCKWGMAPVSSAISKSLFPLKSTIGYYRREKQKIERYKGEKETKK